MLATLQIRLFGGLRVTFDGKPITGFYSNKAPALLAYLAITRRAPTRDSLAALLWGEMSDADAKTNLRQCLTNLRKLLEPHLLITRDTVEFNFDAPYALDIELFEQKLRAQDLSAAVELYTGDFLDGVFVRDAPEFEEWMLAQRARLRDLALQTMSALVTQHAARGDNARGIEYATRLIALDPWREETHRDLMLMLARTGQRSVALQQYEVCKRELREQMDVEPSAETTALYERIRAAGDATRHNLPAQPTSFIGRTKELANIETRLLQRDCRLLTLLGTGGVGKTRLALEAAERALKIGAFLYGVFFVPLAGVNSPDRLVAAMADTCGFTFTGKQDPKTQLANFLREKETLFVLDNFEHLLDAATWLAQLQSDAPHVKLLITSRERLNVRAEWLIAIEGLDYPDFRSDTTAPIEIQNRKWAAVELFVERARQVRGDLETSDALWTSVARVCQLVEGLPLGIELAAAWTQTHTCDDIAHAIARGYAFLATTARDVPERQRSLRAVFDYSWRLLSEHERAVMARLSVFRGGFTREAAEWVAGASLTTLTALVDQSLVRSSAGRYGLHQVVREYAAEKLGASVDAEAAVRDRHGEYLATFLAQLAAPIQGANQKDALNQVGGEMDNVNAAWQWMIARRRADWVESSFVSLGYFYEIKSRFQEGLAAFQQAAAAFAGASEPAQQKLYAKLLIPQMSFLIRLDRYAEARAVGYTCLTILRDTDAQTEFARAVNNLGHITYRLGNLGEAKQFMQESVALTRAGGNLRMLSVALNNLGAVTLARGEYAEARQVFEECLTIKRQLGDQRSIANTLDNLGIIAREQKDFALAREFHQESLAIYQSLDDQRGAQTALNNLGALAFREGHCAEARQFLRQSLSMGSADSHRGIIAGFTLLRLGAVACALGDYAEARQHLRDALDTAVAINAVPLALLVCAEFGALWHAEGNSAGAVEIIALVAAHASSEQEARDRAQSLLGAIAPRLKSTAFTAAQARGRARQLEEVSAEILRG
ncbi:MAG: tetratricopeptide repeat protein [Chloroflexi bacterium]|nr:tetratricopeptide repeat protein [Chloroflexota bacterium]